MLLSNFSDYFKWKSNSTEEVDRGNEHRYCREETILWKNISEYIRKKEDKERDKKTSTEPQLIKEGKQAFMLQGCFVNWNQQPTSHLQDFYNSATLSSRLGVIFLPLDNAIFVLIIAMIWEVFFGRGFWKVQYASLLPWTSQSDCLDLLPFQLRNKSSLFQRLVQKG